MTFFEKPGKCVLDSLKCRATFAIETGIISQEPVIDSVDRNQTVKEFWTIKISVPEADFPFWYGVYQGIVFAQLNKIEVVGYP